MKIPHAKDLVNSTRPYAVEDKRKSWFLTISTLLYLVIAIIMTYLNFHWISNVVFCVLSSLLTVRFFIIFHDFLHGAILRESRLANVIMTVFGLYNLTPVTIWKRTHDYHHHHNSKLSNAGIGSYPLLNKDDYLALNKKQKFMYMAARHPITIALGYIALFILDFNVKSMILNPKVHWDSLVSVVLHFIIGYLLYHFKGLEVLLFCFIIPFFISHCMGAYFFYAQHNFPGALFDDNRNWDYAKAAINSTSFMVMNPVMNWFTGNVGYHHVHHANHKIPFYNLKSAMDGIKELQDPIITSLKFKDIAACLRLKVWDAEKGEMTGL